MNFLSKKEQDIIYQSYFNPTPEEIEERLELLKDSICMEKIRAVKITDKVKKLKCGK